MSKVKPLKEENFIENRNISLDKYAAFISYSHGNYGVEAARALRDSLERFKDGSGKVQSIGQVFLDDGELSAHVSFSEDIRYALKNSEWLIVLCSNDAKKSEWVDAEIRTFLEYHDKSHILAVLLSGEPEDVYNDALLENGLDEDHLLAADARADGSIKSIIKAIRGDVTLRLAAPIMGVSYAMLKQRQKEFELKRRFRIISICLIFLCIFMGFALLKTSQLNREHEEALKNQAEVITSEAKQSMEENNPIETLNLGVSACDIMGEIGKISPDAINTMSRTMRLYITPDKAEGMATASDMLYTDFTD